MKLQDIQKVQNMNYGTYIYIYNKVKKDCSFFFFVYYILYICIFYIYIYIYTHIYIYKYCVTKVICLVLQIKSGSPELACCASSTCARCAARSGDATTDDRGDAPSTALGVWEQRLLAWVRNQKRLVWLRSQRRLRWVRNQ